jgi:hypothetical protein
MAIRPTSSGIRDNHKRGSVADFLRAKIQPGSRLSIVSAYFTIYAYDALKEHLDAARNDTLWRKASERIKKSGVGVTISLLKEILNQLFKQSLGLP